MCLPKKKDMAPCVLGEPSGDRVQKICTGVGATDMEEFPLPQRCCVPGMSRPHVSLRFPQSFRCPVDFHSFLVFLVR